MFNLSAESFPDDSIVANLSIHAISAAPQISHPLETLPIIQRESIGVADELPRIELALPETSDAVAAPGEADSSSKLYQKSLTNGSRRIGGAFKRSVLSLSKKSASVDSLLHNGAPRINDNFIAGAAGMSSGAALKRNTYRGYEHVQSKVKVDIDNAKQHDNKRRSKFLRHQSMPETLCPDLVSLVEFVDASLDDAELVKILRDEVAAKDLLIEQKNLLISQLTFLSETVEQESHDKIKLQRKIEAMRMEIMKVNDQNRQYQEELRLLTLKLASNSGSASAVSSSGSFPISGVHTDSSAGSSCRQYNSYNSSSGVSSVSPAFPSDDRFMVQRKSKRSEGQSERDRSLSADGTHNQYRQIGRSTDDIVLFDKSNIDDCPITSSSSTSHDFFEGFQGSSAKQLAAGLRRKRRKRFTATALRKRISRVAKYCTPCLQHRDDSEEDIHDTSLLYIGLDGELAANSRYNSFN